MFTAAVARASSVAVGVALVVFLCIRLWAHSLDGSDAYRLSNVEHSVGGAVIYRFPNGGVGIGSDYSPGGPPQPLPWYYRGLSPEMRRKVYYLLHHPLF